MNKRNLKSYETSYLFLVTFLITQIFLIFINIYYTQTFPIENFTVVVIQLLSILLSYFIGIVPAALFSIIYVVAYIFYIMTGEQNINIVTYILLFFVPLSTIYAGNMNQSRKEIINDLHKLEKLENIQLKMDPRTNLENEYAFKDLLSKYSNLAYRYPEYTFSVSMFRLEFVETLRTLLDAKEFGKLIEDIAEVIQSSIREEDSKFIVSNDRFIIITPMTSYDNIKPAVRRVVEASRKFSIKNKDGDIVDIVLKVGGLDYSKERHDLFKDHKQILLELQRETEVDVYGEYAK
ncbi:MAG: diguanylate cyclase [Epulopiscium sp.]|nr:diguanylate cyclase [Candidatus Epulonipiscium sp.]